MRYFTHLRGPLACLILWAWVCERSRALVELKRHIFCDLLLQLYLAILLRTLTSVLRCVWLKLDVEIIPLTDRLNVRCVHQVHVHNAGSLLLGGLLQMLLLSQYFICYGLHVLRRQNWHSGLLDSLFTRNFCVVSNDHQFLTQLGFIWLLKGLLVSVVTILTSNWATVHNSANIWESVLFATRER